MPSLFDQLQMPNRRRLTALAGVAILFAMTAAGAAPLPPFEPADICGRILSVRFEPEVAVAGRPGVSGSLGHDRVFPAHLRVVLDRVRGVDDARRSLINNLVGADDPSPGSVTLDLPTNDPSLLDGARSICVTGFAVRGDEGGTWTSYRNVTREPPG